MLLWIVFGVDFVLCVCIIDYVCIKVFFSVGSIKSWVSLVNVGKELFLVGKRVIEVIVNVFGFEILKWLELELFVDIGVDSLYFVFNES